jgi:hypothetical protein
MKTRTIYTTATTLGPFSPSFCCRRHARRGLQRAPSCSPIGNMFLLFTASGEGSCFSGGCAYTSYCAYHGYFSNGSSTVIYGNEPYAAAPYCQAGTSPNNDPAADAAASIATFRCKIALSKKLVCVQEAIPRVCSSECQIARPMMGRSRTGLLMLAARPANVPC